MGLNLRKLKDAVIAQVNTFDGGKTWKNPNPVKPQPAQTPPPSYGGGVRGVTNWARDRFDANTPQDFAKRNAQNKAFAGSKNYNLTYEQQQQQRPSFISAAMSSPLSPTNVLKTVANTVGQPVVANIDLVKAGVGQLTGNDQARNNALKAAQQKSTAAPKLVYNTFINPSIKGAQAIGENAATAFSGDARNAEQAQTNLVDQLEVQKLDAIKRAKQGFQTQGQIDQFNKYADNLWNDAGQARFDQMNAQQEKYQKIDPTKNAALIADAGLTALSFGVAGVTKQGMKAAATKATEKALAKGLSKDVAMGIGGKAARNNFISNTVSTGVLGASQGAVSPYAVQAPGTVKGSDVLRGALMGGTLGAAMPAAFVKMGGGKINLRPQTRATTKEATTLSNLLNNRGGFMKNGVYEDGMAVANKYGIDLGTPDGIQQAQGIVDASRHFQNQPVKSRFGLTKMNQGGYVKNPLGKDPPVESKGAQVGKTEGVAPTGNTLDEPFKHPSWYKKQKLTKREALDKIAEEDNIFLDKQYADESLQPANPFAPGIYDDVLSDGRKNSKVWQLTPEEKKYYELKRAEHNVTRRQEALDRANEWKQTEYLPIAEMELKKAKQRLSELSPESDLTKSTPPKTVAPKSAPIDTTPQVDKTVDAPKPVVKTAPVAKPVVKSAQPTKPNVVKSVKPEKPVVEPIDSHGTTLATEIKRGLSDKDQVILDELRNIEKQTGQKGLVDKFMYNSNMQRGSNATANVELRTSKNINEAIGGLSKKEYKAFSDYANARTELSTADNVVATSRPKADLEATVAAGDGAYGARFEALNKHYKGLASEAEKSGLISKETAALYKKNNDYVRLQKDMGDLVNQGGRGGNSFSIGSTVMGQKRKGSSRANLNAGEVTAEYTQQVYKEIARNRTASHLASSLENAGLATKLDDAAAARNQNVMKVMKKGKPEYYQVSADIKEAVDNINPYHMNVVMQILATPGRIVRAGITGLNPVFIARNLLKDQVGSAINSEHIMSTHNPASFFRGLFNATADSVGASNNPLYKDFLKHYGDQTSFDLTRNVKESGQVINRIRGGKAIGVGQALKSPIRTLENFASITEKSTRFQSYVGEYKKAIAQGLSKDAASEKAAIAAWQNSVDFSRAGTWGRVINTVVPYWNPSTQGVRQMGRTFTKHPVKSGLTATALVGVPIATATAWNLSNPETAAIYNNIPEYEKDNNLVLVPPGTTQNKDGSYDIIKIPLPPGYKDAFMPIRRVMESYYGKKPIEGAKIAQDILQVVGGPVNFQTKGAFIGSFIPQAAKPAVQWATNTDLFSGRKTEPEYVQNATDAQGNPIPNGDKAFKYTSGTASIIGKKTNSSPMKIEKLVKDIGGTVGLNLLNASDQALAKAGVINKEQVGGLSVSEGFVRSFGKAQGIDNSNKTAGAKYYDTINKVQNEAKLTVAEKNAWDALHPGKKNFLGETVYENDSTYNPAARLDAYNRFPKVFEVDKKIDAEGRKNGKPGNPIYDLESWQVKKVLEKENLPPGAKDPELSNLYSKDWYADYSTNKSKYFTAIGESQKKDLADAKASGDTAKASSIQASMDKYNNSSNKYPVTPPELQKTMDYYSSLPKGTGARSAWIKSNPGQWKMMQDQFAAIDNWQNIARGERGLDATEGAVGDAAGYGDGSSGYSKYGYSRSGGSGGGGSSSKTGLNSDAPNLYKYALSVNSPSKPTVKKAAGVAKVGVAMKTKTAKPKVTIKKSKA